MTKGIVIGAGRSFWESPVLPNIKKMIDKHTFKDTKLIICDRVATNVIDYGINPDNCKMVIVTSESTYIDDLRQFYINSSVYDYKDVINVFISRSTNLKLHKEIMPYFYNYHHFVRKGKPTTTEATKLFDPIIECCGNVGMACYGIAKTVLGCDQIAFIGLDFKHYKYDIDNWIVEGQLSLKEIKKNQKEIAHFNLSPIGLFYESGLFINCSLDQFINDTYPTVKIIDDLGVKF